jgi:hypothetical protein
MAKGQSKKGGKKKGRNATYCNAYKLEQREAKNKLRRVRRHLRKHPGDVSAMQAMEDLGKILHFKPETFHDLTHVKWGSRAPGSRAPGSRAPAAA